MKVGSSMHRWLLSFAGVTAVGIAVLGQAPPASVFTTSQAAAGRTIYQENCASCHLPDLSGRNEAPQLAGGNFMNTWGPRTTTDLIRYIQSAMPPSNRGGLSEEICSNIVAFFLQANGAPAGNLLLAISPEVRIGSVAD